jgi:thiamine-phosphate pyrophosphorylase
VLTYYITDRSQFAGSELERRAHLLRTIRQAAAAGVDLIQLREKDLSIRELESLAREALGVIRAVGAAKLLINHRTDVALAVGADGVHLAGTDVAASEARSLAAKPRSAQFGASQFRPSQFLVAVSCHSVEEVRSAEAHGADFAVLAPVFEKMEKMNVVSNGIGLEELRRATGKSQPPDLRVEAGENRGSIPVLGLGGVDLERAPLCAEAGAMGIAGIRLFQQAPDLTALVHALRAL